MISHVFSHGMLSEAKHLYADRNENGEEPSLLAVDDAVVALKFIVRTRYIASVQ